MLEPLPLQTPDKARAATLADSHGRKYRLVPSGVRAYAPEEAFDSLGRPVVKQCVTHTVQDLSRMRPNGTFAPRIRMSKKTRLRIKRELGGFKPQPRA